MPGAKHLESSKGLSRKKAGGVFSHSVHNLKKVARMPGNNHSKVLKILRKKVCQQQPQLSLKRSVEVVSQDPYDGSSSSSSSVNNDWKHWVVLRGSEKVVVEDV